MAATSAASTATSITTAESELRDAIPALDVLLAQKRFDAWDVAHRSSCVAIHRSRAEWLMNTSTQPP
jgi:hypothetical protein